ncbi:MAG: LuxR family transcriptional regulator, partial [Ilumatobacteraceae bacterium]
MKRSKPPFGHDARRWHRALALAVDHNLRLVAVDALEGLAVDACNTESFIETLRLLGAAERLRDETGYRWRFAGEQRAVDEATNASRTAVGDGSDAASAEGYYMDWRIAAAYANRARGERRRPRHGWASLTPTEEEVT